MYSLKSRLHEWDDKNIPRTAPSVYSGENYIIFCKAHKMHVQLYYYNDIGTRETALLILQVILIDLTDPSSQIL